MGQGMTTGLCDEARCISTSSEYGGSVDRSDRPESTDSAQIVGKRVGDTVIAFPYAASAARDQAFAGVLAGGWIGRQGFGGEVLLSALESLGIGGFGGTALSAGLGHVQDPLEDEQVLRHDDRGPFDLGSGSPGELPGPGPGSGDSSNVGESSAVFGARFPCGLLGRGGDDRFAGNRIDRHPEHLVSVIGRDAVELRVAVTIGIAPPFEDVDVKLIDRSIRLLVAPMASSARTGSRRSNFSMAAFL